MLNFEFVYSVHSSGERTAFYIFRQDLQDLPDDNNNFEC